MKRRLLNLFAGLSMLLCVTLAAWWVRSFYAVDQLVYVWTSESPAIYGNLCLGAYSGTIEFSYLKQQSPSLKPMIHEQRRLKNTGVLYLKSVVIPTPPNYRLWNFESKSSTAHGYHEEARWFRLRLWPLALLMAMAAAAFSWPAIRHRKRSTAGLCTVCGYDLRMTPDRCPECGVFAKTQDTHFTAK
jgi:hypothetical protein